MLMLKVTQSLIMTIKNDAIDEINNNNDNEEEEEEEEECEHENELDEETNNYQNGKDSHFETQYKIVNIKGNEDYVTDINFDQSEEEEENEHEYEYELEREKENANENENENETETETESENEDEDEDDANSVINSFLDECNSNNNEILYFHKNLEIFSKYFPVLFQQWHLSNMNNKNLELLNNCLIEAKVSMNDLMNINNQNHKITTFPTKK